MSFVLAHRPHRRVGQEALGYKKEIAYEDKKYLMDIKQGGYFDCGQAGLAQGLAAEKEAAFPVVGVGSNAAQAFAPYRTKIDGQRIAIISATQIIASNLVSAFTATASQGGVASALDPTQLIRAVQDRYANNSLRARHGAQSRQRRRNGLKT